MDEKWVKEFLDKLTDENLRDDENLDDDDMDDDWFLILKYFELNYLNRH